jgi:hypothetical protein
MIEIARKAISRGPRRPGAARRPFPRLVGLAGRCLQARTDRALNFAGALFGAILILSPASCGYTVLKHDEPARSPAPGQTAEPSPGAEIEGSGEELVLPPGHPPILTEEDWIGRSFLDNILGDDEPLRFENLRADPRILMPSDHALITLRVTMGGPAVADIWQLRIDEFGWVTMARWLQGSADPELDEGLAADRVEFRLDRASEAALRAMLIAVMPISQEKPSRVPSTYLRDLPLEFWPHDDPGLIEIDYRIERLDATSPEDWPGGKVLAPVDLIQVLIGTWDDEPPDEILELMRRTIEARPSLIDLGLLIEGLVLAWEVEGERQREIDLPLRVGR